jgi:hypothetical protein
MGRPSNQLFLSQQFTYINFSGRPEYTSHRLCANNVGAHICTVHSVVPPDIPHFRLHIAPL